MAVGSIPVVGTMVYWKTMSPGWQAFSIATDVLAFAPVGRLIKGLKYINKVPGMQAVDDAIRAGRAETRTTLKATAGAATVKAFDDTVKAGGKYAENLATLKHFERQAARLKSLGGSLLDEEITAWQKAKDATRLLREEAIQAGNKFGKSFVKKYDDVISGIQKRIDEMSRRKPATMAEKEQIHNIITSLRNDIERLRTTMGKTGFDTIKQLDDFGRTYAQGISQTVDDVYRNIPKVKTIQRQIKAAQNALEVSESLGDTDDVIRKTDDIMELKQKLRISQSGEALNLTNKRYELLGKIDDIEKRVDEIRGRKPATSAELKQNQTIIKSLVNDIRKLKAELQATVQQQSTAFKNMEIEWAEPIKRSSGRGGIVTTPRGPATRFTGGGLMAPTTQKPLSYAMPGAKLLFTTADGVQEWQIPGVKTIDVRGGKPSTLNHSLTGPVKYR